MADANQLAAALQYQQELEAAVRPQMMNPNIAEQGRKGRANMAPPTSVMDTRSRDYERRARETENFLIGADILAGALPFAPLAKGAAMAAGKYAGPELARGLENYMVKSGAVLPMDVWHGSPHRFPPTAKNPLGEFDPMKVGTGEGNQSYGVGAGYLAEAKDVAKEYRRTLRNINPSYDGIELNDTVQKTAAELLMKAKGDKAAAIKDAQNYAFDNLLIPQINKMDASKISYGNLYKVDLPDEHIAKMLDWDKPMSQQSPEVQAVARKRLEELRAMGGSIPKDPTGEWIHKAFGPQGGEKALDGLYGQSAASVRLREAGIPGIRYLDQGSRGAGQGTSNFVVFDPAHMNILERNGVTAASLRNVAPQDEALRLAQQRAALPVKQGGLGLPADNTPAQRATAMGFDKTAYHATDADILAFDNAKLGTNTASLTGGDKDAIQSAMQGHWFSDRDLTNKDPRGYMFGDVSYPVKLANPKIINDKEFQSKSFIVKDPDNIRSRFAAFDPFRRNAALAAALGVAAPDLLAEEK